MKNALLAKLLQRDPEKEKAHYEAFGRFIAAYAAAEAEIHTVARSFSKTDDERARIIFGGLRISDSIDRLRALMRVIDPPLSMGILGLVAADHKKNDIELIERCIAQFNEIGQRRDKLIHRTITFDDTGFKGSNGATAKSLASAELGLLITQQDLVNMKIDCQMIFLGLADLRREPGEPKWSPGGLPTWRYTPPPPTPRTPKRPEGRRARKRQRRASQQK